jgi:hypothetical protein
MEVLEAKDDGTVVLELTEEENRILIEYAVNMILKEAIERMKNEHRSNRGGGEVHTKETS